MPSFPFHYTHQRIGSENLGKTQVTTGKYLKTHLMQQQQNIEPGIQLNRVMALRGLTWDFLQIICYSESLSIVIKPSFITKQNE